MFYGGKQQNDFEDVQVQSYNMIIRHNSIATRDYHIHMSVWVQNTYSTTQNIRFLHVWNAMSNTKLHKPDIKFLPSIITSQFLKAHFCRKDKTDSIYIILCFLL
jgi:hypothetical protein